jgi:hypothetical protein
MWKHEIVQPTPKVFPVDDIKQLRKKACTSDYNKVFESFIKDIIMQDIVHKIDLSQYGGRKGVGTEYMIVALLDRVLALLDKNPDKSAVILTGVDWANAFARGDPTTTIQKFLILGLRPSIVPLLIDYFTGRKMTVKFNTGRSSIINLIGSFPEGSLIGQDSYVVSSNDCASMTDPEDRYRYIDDLEITDLITMAGLLIDYDVWTHVPSDIGVHQKYLKPEHTQTQNHLNEIQR